MTILGQIQEILNFLPEMNKITTFLCSFESEGWKVMLFCTLLRCYGNQAKRMKNITNKRGSHTAKFFVKEPQKWLIENKTKESFFLKKKHFWLWKSFQRIPWQKDSSRQLSRSDTLKTTKQYY